MKHNDLKVVAWLIGRLATYFVLLMVFNLTVAVCTIYIKDGSLINLWKMQLDCTTSCLGEVLGVYTPQSDLSSMPNQDAVHSDIVYALMLFAYLAACWMTVKDLHKREMTNKKVD